MGTNIIEVSGNSAPGAGGPGDPEFVFVIDLSQTGVVSVTGDFDLTRLLSTGDAGTYTEDFVDSGLATLVLDSTTGQFTFTVDRAAILATGSDQIFNFTITTDFEEGDSALVSIEVLICVLRGTLIATSDGDRRVEELRPGDLILLHDGRTEPVSWIGSRVLSAEELSADPDLRPILIRANALGPERPQRDLRVSPQHRVLVEGAGPALLFGEDAVLAPAKALVDGKAVMVDTRAEDVEYFHIMFARHEVMVTEGLPSESFYPGDYSLGALGEAARQELLTLFPELSTGVASYGPAAFPALRPREARVLTADNRAA